MSYLGKILLIDSDTAGRRALHGGLLAAGFEVTDAEHSEEALAFCRVVDFEIALVNIPPHERETKVCQSIRAGLTRGAILVLTEFNDPDRIAEILEAGADQCLARSLYLPELVARIRATLRRVRSSPNHSTDAISIGDIRLEPGQRTVYKAGEAVRLTPKEFTLLHYLMRNAGLPISHASLLKEAWGDEHVGRVEYLRIFMQQLRAKLDDSVSPRYLLTDSCIGYHFVESAPGSALANHVGRAA